MLLSHFISALFQTGEVSVDHSLEFDEEASSEILSEVYKRDVMDMPAGAPPFAPQAALWAASYLYQAIQLTVYRDLDEEAISGRLAPYEGVQTPEIIYSVDLVHRNLPRLFHLAKGLAPADRLVETLRSAAATWPLSSVGINLEKEAEDQVILEDSFLRAVYLDRIIREKARDRLAGKERQAYIYEIAGNHLSVIWPELNLI